ncbi:MAG: dephospho-CoA kinase [Arenimonas sp. SCN 70-307]|uniref:dephospho-CoA kinase n=1 Tax=Arenimonas sp. SCN 70-307 TaxID=1660089 RepID=UPI00086F1F82|nr:dephospho-CoA kinase [Arenimonas sp. SCN 70-307]ODS63098.1 MAG: dephospho-CoA kinase [Arenimonas sp. SCN 70-307]
MAAFVVAVTGGVASGKSEATREFERLGITVADADVAARAVVEPGQPTLAAVVAHFGAGVLGPDGRIDRAAMRQHVFNDPPARTALEGLLHPPIRAWLRAACEAATSPYVVVAIPLLAEGGGRAAYPWLGRILVVDVPGAVQLARLQARDGVDAALAARMVAAQASRAQRLALADDVIINDGGLFELQDAVRRLHARYLESSP